MKISELAKVAGINIETIRYYERRDLIERPIKPMQGHRTYPTKTFERIQFIKRAQELGFTLKEIANLLLLGKNNCASVQGMTEEKLINVRSKIVYLSRLEHALSSLVTQCISVPSSSSCPIVEALLPNKKSYLDSVS